MVGILVFFWDSPFSETSEVMLVLGSVDTFVIFYGLLLGDVFFKGQRFPTFTLFHESRWVDWLVTPLPSSVAKSKGLMIDQYMGVAPSTFQVVYVCIRLFFVGHFLGEFLLG